MRVKIGIVLEDDGSTDVNITVATDGNIAPELVSKILELGVEATQQNPTVTEKGNVLAFMKPHTNA